MKTLAKFAAITVLALAAAAPAFAIDVERQTVDERNTYLYTSDARMIDRASQDVAGFKARAQATVAVPVQSYDPVRGEFADRTE